MVARVGAGRNRTSCGTESRLAREERGMKARPPEQPRLRLLSIVIPTRDEEHEIASTVEHLYLEMRLHQIAHEIVIVDDGSRDRTWEVISDLKQRIPTVSPVRNP